MGRRRGILWALLVVASTALWLIGSPEEAWVVPLMIVMWLVTIVSLMPRLRPMIGTPLRWLRDRPILYWAVILAYLVGAITLWLVPYQPTNGRLLTPAEYILLLAALWLFMFLLAYDADVVQLRSMGTKLGKSRLSGVMVTLTTLLIFFVAAESWLRVYYITTDGYGFTAMNYHWYKNFYWGHYNSLGYRDYEPLEDEDGGLQRIAIVGDSFAMGHGINNIDDTFPQLLEERLGAGHDVNLIAQSGWDSDIELYHLDEYPLEPDIVVLSYYLNDINFLITDAAQSPDRAFDLPENRALAWVVRNFFVPNYAYYNMLQFASSARTTDFESRMTNLYLDDDLWAKQAWWLNEIVEWTREHDARLVVLLWPQIAAVAESQPATVRVRDFFLERDVEVVDMTDVLIDKDPRQMIVNRFDTHPGLAAQQLAADQLYAAITGS